MELKKIIELMIDIKKNYLKFFSIFFILIISFVIALQLPGYNWETDYGHHYYISMFNGKETNLYLDFQFHKGPVSFLILDILGLIINYGWKQSIISYFIITCIFFFVVKYYINYELKNVLFTIISLVYFLAFFRNQGSNIFSDINLNIFLFLSFIFFIKFIDNLKYKNIFYFTFFFTLAILCRIDIIFYFFPFFFIFILFLIREKKFKILNFKFILLNLIIVLLTFFLLLFFYNYGIEDFISSNIYFNLEYSKDYFKFKNISYLYHLTPNKILCLILIVKLLFYYKENLGVKKKIKSFLLIITVFQIIFFLFKIEEFIFFNFLYLLEIVSLLYIFFLNKNYKNYKLLIAIVFKYTSIFIYLYAGSFKLNHVFILLLGFFIYYIFFIKFLIKTNWKFKKIIIFLLIILSIDQSVKIFNSLERPLERNNNIALKYGINNFFYNPEIIKSNTVSSFILKNNSAVICDRAWPHIFNNKRSNGFMFDWWFYDENKKILNKDIIKNFHKDILNKKYGEIFLIDQGCVSKSIFSKSKLITKLIKNSNIINTIDFFEYKFDVRKIK